MNKIIIISGKARAGKNTTADFIKDYCDDNNLKSINLAYGDYIKEYAKKISSWDGSDETKPRSLLQELGTDIIRVNFGDEFFINKMIDDIKVYSHYFDVITISDARFPKEIDLIKSNFNDAISVNVIRPNFDNGLSDKEKAHASEIALDNYNNYDYNLLNEADLKSLESKVSKIMEVLL